MTTLLASIIAILTAAVILATKIVEFQLAREKRKTEIPKPEKQITISEPIIISSRRSKYDLFMGIAMLVIYIFMTVGLFYYSRFGATTPVTFREAAFLVMIGTMIVVSSRPLR